MRYNDSVSSPKGKPNLLLDMKKILILCSLLCALPALAETYVWNGSVSEKWSDAANWTVESTGQPAESLPAYNNTSEDTYIIGDGATVDALSYSIGNYAGTLKVGDNVTIKANWDFIFRDATIGKGFSMPSGGDGLKFGGDEANKLVIDSVYEGNKILSTLAASSSIDFQQEGKITSSGYDLSFSGKALTFTAVVETSAAAPQAGYEVVTRLLIGGSNIYNRDGANGPDYANSYVIGTGGDSLKRLDLYTSTGSISSADLTALYGEDGVLGAEDVGNYRFFATYDDGIGIQYVRELVAQVVPEPATATLSLLALCGMAARRRRK